MTAHAFLSDQIKKLADFYDVTVIANLSSKKYLLDELSQFANIKNISIKKDIDLFGDLKALLLLMVFFYRERFILVHSVTPKAGLLTMLSSWIIRVPIRLHTFTGQVWATKKGLIRILLRFLDKVIHILSTQTIVDSHSQLNYLESNNVISKSRAIVFGKGSISGVDFKRFKVDLEIRERIRLKLGINESTFLLLFLGRFKKEKGILELTKAFSIIHQEYDNSILWCVGPDDDDLQKKIELIEGVKIFPYTETPEDYMIAADLFCLPSYREGFGTAVIEAAACGIPSVGSNVYGLSDAIINGKTGILVEPRDYLALMRAIKKLIEDGKLRSKMGEAARERALKYFSKDYFTKEIVELYKMLLQNSS